MARLTLSLVLTLGAIACSPASQVDGGSGGGSAATGGGSGGGSSASGGGTVAPSDAGFASTQNLVGSGTLTPLGATLTSTDGRVTVIFGREQVDAPTHVSIVATTSGLTGSLLPSLGYDIDIATNGRPLTVGVKYRYSSAELAAGRALVTAEDGGALTYVSPGDAGFPLPVEQPSYLLARLLSQTDGGTLESPGVSSFNADFAGTTVLEAQLDLPAKAVGVRLTAIRVGISASTGSSTVSPIPIALPVNGSPQTYACYVEVPAPDWQYHIDQDYFPESTADFVSVTGAGVNQLDQVIFGPGATRTHPAAFACTAPGSGIFDCMVHGNIEAVRPPSVPFNATANFRVWQTFTCGDGGTPLDTGHTLPLEGGDVTSDDGRVTAAFDLFSVPTSVAIVRAASTVPNTVLPGIGYTVVAPKNPSGITVPFVTYRMSAAELATAEAALTDDVALDAGVTFHVVELTGHEDGGVLSLWGTTLPNIDGAGTTVAEIYSTRNLTDLGVTVTPMRVGLSASSLNLNAGAAPTSFTVAIAIPSSTAAYTVNFAQMVADVASTTSGLIAITQGTHTLDNSTLMPGQTESNTVGVACTDAGVGYLEVSTSTESVLPGPPDMENFPEVTWVAIPITCH